MKQKAKLTARESQIAELIAWGASKKEVAEHLFISVRTVENHVRAIFDKINCTCATELSAWWFCNRFNISYLLAPSISRFAAICLLSFFISANVVIYNQEMQARRVRSRIAQTERTYRSARRENYYPLNLTA